MTSSGISPSGQKLKINFVGSFTQGYVGETADEVHLANELEEYGSVRRIGRDIWKAYVEEGRREWEILDDLTADINIICKWHHFGDPNIIRVLRKKSGAPVFYWVWDYMYDGGFPEWHRTMCQNADLYLSNEGGLVDAYKQEKVPFYYFPFDVSSKEFDKVYAKKIYDVTFFGSCIHQGQRRAWLPAINKKHKVKVFSWNWEDWKDLGLDAEPAVYGNDFARKVAESRICLQFSVNDECWGYWSNRVGKVLSVGGFLLARYAPGMELFLRDGCAYFSSVREAISQISYYLENPDERKRIARRGYKIGRDRFTSDKRIEELVILIRRYLNGGYPQNSTSG